MLAPGPGMRLNIGVLSAKEILRALDRKRLDLVDNANALVVASTGIALGVFDIEMTGERLEDCRATHNFRLQ